MIHIKYVFYEQNCYFLIFILNIIYQQELRDRLTWKVHNQGGADSTT